MVATKFLFLQMKQPGPQQHITRLQWLPDKKVSLVQHSWRKHQSNLSGSGISKSLMVSPGPSVDYHSCACWGGDNNFDTDSAGSRAVILDLYTALVHYCSRSLFKLHKVSMTSPISVRRLTPNLQRDRLTHTSHQYEKLDAYQTSFFLLNFVHLDKQIGPYEITIQIIYWLG